MSFEIMNITPLLMQKQAVEEIVECNDHTHQFGLTLSRTEALQLVETRNLALKNNGRIEFGGGAINKIIKAFSDSPYITVQNYAETLHDLTEMFYFYKNETLDKLGDNDLIAFMKQHFDGTCHGSLELLAGRELYNMARNLRYGRSPEATDNLMRDEEDEYASH